MIFLPEINWCNQGKRWKTIGEGESKKEEGKACLEFITCSQDQSASTFADSNNALNAFFAS